MNTGRLSVVSTDEVIRAFEHLGFSVIKKRGKGSHVVMASESHAAILTIPRRRELRRGTLRKLIRDAGIDVGTFCDLLSR